MKVAYDFRPDQTIGTGHQQRLHGPGLLLDVSQTCIEPGTGMARTTTEAGPMIAVRLLVFCLVLLGLWAVSLTPQSHRLRDLDFRPFQAELARFEPAQSEKIGRWVRGSNIPQLQVRMARRELTSEELTLYFLAQIYERDEHLRGYIELNPLALQEARNCDRLRALGRLLGPMHGIPINLKDNIETGAPMHTSAGAEILLNYVPTADAPLVSQLRGSGAVILGKASLSELAGVVSSRRPGSNAISGAGINPYREGLPVLGSSSGSAITTSAYLTTVSVGTETSGSLLAPATLNGVVAMKPSLQRVSGEGVIPLIHFQDSPGPVARNVTDAAILLACLARSSRQPFRGLRPDALRGVRVGLLPEAWTPGLRSRRIQSGLDRAGANSLRLQQSLQGIDLTESLVLAVSYDLIPCLQGCGAPVHNLAELHGYNAARPGRRIPFGQDFLDLCLSKGPTLLNQAGIEEGEAVGYYRKISLANRLRATQILTEAFRHDQLEVLVSHTNLASEYYATAGFPAITVPLGVDLKGAPIGVTLIGKLGQDDSLLNYAFAMEQSTLLRVEP